MTREAQLAKFRRNCCLASHPVPAAKTDRLIHLIDALEDVKDVSALVDEMVG